jgi:hypothetical protein
MTVGTSDMAASRGFSLSTTAGNKWRVKSLDAILATAAKKSLTRSLGAFQLTMLGIGGIIGTGIFVLTAEAAQLAGPGLLPQRPAPVSTPCRWTPSCCAPWTTSRIKVTFSPACAARGSQT